MFASLFAPFSADSHLCIFLLHQTWLYSILVNQIQTISQLPRYLNTITHCCSGPPLQEFLMVLLLISSLPSLLLFIKHLSNKSLYPSWVYEFGLLTVLLCQEFIHHSLEWIKNCRISRAQILKSTPAVKAEDCHETAAAEMAVLDLPELALECILARLSPAELFNMAGVCRSLRDRCRSDHLWQRHMREKWRRVIGEEASRELELKLASRRGFTVSGEAGGVQFMGWMGSLACVWPLSWLKHKMEGGRKARNSLPANSVIALYLALENGRLSFPAQIYNRENGHAGFLMSCYDAEISYNSGKNKFYVRYPPHGKKIPAIEEVPWERIRAPSVVSSAHDLHISDCLSGLQPGDHIEIQWRKNKEFPYGWWFGVVGHLEICDRSDHRCLCHASDTIVLEFKHYAPGSRWRTKTINRKEHREDGNENDGFYGGVRKIKKKEEVSKWMQFWPAEILE